MTITATPAMLTLPALKRWAQQNKDLGLAVVGAQVFAEMERKRVDAYILPLFESFEFYPAENMRAGSERITNIKDLFLTDLESPNYKAFCAACDEAHRAHGFIGESGYCPALIAETKVTEAEWDLLAAAAPLFGMEPDDARGMCGDIRKKALEILVGVCVLAAKGGN